MQYIGTIPPDPKNPADRDWSVFVVYLEDFRRYGIAEDTDTPKIFRGFTTTPYTLYGIPSNLLQIELGTEIKPEDVSKIRVACLCQFFAGELPVPFPCPWCDGSGILPTREQRAEVKNGG